MNGVNYPDPKDYESDMMESIFYPERTRMKQKLLMKAVDDARKEEEYQKEQEYMSPMEQAFARKYFRENPGEIGDFQGIPGIGMQAKQTGISQGTGAKAKTSQGISVPSTYTPPDLQAGSSNKTMKMTQKGFAPMNTKEQLIENAAQKYLRGEATDKERKMLGIDKEEAFRGDLENVAKGTMAIDKLKKKYPMKEQEIKSYQVEQMNPMTQNVMGQIEDQLGSFQQEEGQPMVEGYTDHMEAVINQLIDEKEIAEAKGIDVDAIFDVMDIKPSVWKSSGNDKRKDYLKPLYRFFLGGINIGE